MDLSLSFHTNIPIRHIKVTNHLSVPFYLMQSMHSPWIFPYQQSPMILFIFTGSYVFISFPPISHLLSIQLGLYHTSIVMLHVGSTLFISTFMIPFSSLYFFLLCHIYHRLYVHTSNLFFST